MRRLPKRQAHLNAHITPVEAALLARAEVLEQHAQGTLNSPDAGSELLTGTVLAGIAAEFRSLAEELHWF